MQTDNKFFDDLARLASGAMGTMFGLREEFEAQVHQQVERVMQRFDLVTRAEFDAMSAVAQEARIEAEQLAERVTELERLMAAGTGPTGSGTAKKAATKKATAKASAAKTGSVKRASTGKTTATKTSRKSGSTARQTKAGATKSA